VKTSAAVCGILLAAAPAVRATDDPSLVAAAAAGDVARVRPLLGAGLRVRNREGETALHAAAGRGRTEVLLVLIDAGADITARDQLGETPLHTATTAADGRSVEVLLGRNAPIDLWDEEGNTPLHRAAQESNLAAAALLCAGGADLQARNEAGRTALDEARASLTRFEGRGDPPHRQKVVAFLEAGGPCAALAARRAAGAPSADARRELMLSAGCDAGSARDCTNLALTYEQRGAEGDAARALAFYDVGCRGGSARGCAYLGRAYERGHGVSADVSRALQLYQQACAAKDAWGCGYLGQGVCHRPRRPEGSRSRGRAAQGSLRRRRDLELRPGHPALGFRAKPSAAPSGA